MKKSLSALVVLTMLALCSSSQAFFLIYKLSASVKGIDSDYGKMSVPLKGYLVIDNTLNPDDTYSFADANLILYGKNFAKAKVFVQLDYTADQLLDLTSWLQGSSYEFIDIWSYEPFYIEGYFYGKTKPVYIGDGLTLSDISPSSKGVFIVDGGMLLDEDLDIAGTATITAKIWTAFTQEVNDELWTIDDILYELKYYYLEDYTDVTP